MKAALMLILILWLHVFSDFHLQGILANMKQKSWWKKQAERTNNLAKYIVMYSNDYKVALWIHAFEWSFITFLPMFIKSLMNYELWNMSLTYLVLIFTNTFLHKVVDNGKANDEELNLFYDQLLHLIQIVFSWGIWSIFCGW